MTKDIKQEWSNPVWQGFKTMAVGDVIRVQPPEGVDLERWRKPLYNRFKNWSKRQGNTRKFSTVMDRVNHEAIVRRVK